MNFSCYLLAVLCLVLCGCECKETVSVSKHSICRAKGTCEKCLQLPQCGWCASWLEGAEGAGRARCFPLILRNKLQTECSDVLAYKDHGLSLARTAECVCSRDSLQEDCVAPGGGGGDGGGGETCSGRGTCSCGRCVCDKTRDTNGTILANKIISGKYCECDNFSCEGVVGRDCTEGPYCLDAGGSHESK